MQFIIDKSQRDLYKAAWKNFLKTEAKNLKLRIRNGHPQSYMLAQHVLRHILLTDLSKIEHNITKAFSSQRPACGFYTKSELGLRAVSGYFSPRAFSKLTSYLPDYEEFFATLNDAQAAAIVEIADTLYKKYSSGEIK